MYIMNQLLNKILKEQYFQVFKLPKFENKVLENLSEILNNKFDGISEYEDEQLEEAVSGKKFYDSLISKGHVKNEIFDVKIPVEYLKNAGSNKARQSDVLTMVPIDSTLLEKYIREFKKAKETNAELYDKYKKWSNWYNNFHELIFGALPETDACLFLSAVAFASPNTSLDVNIQEAAKLYRAVKDDWRKSNVTRKALLFIVNNITTIDNQINIDTLKKLANSNSSYASMLAPKRETHTQDQKQIREITVSRAKLNNYNNFVKYFIENNGKLTRQEILRDLQTGKLNIGGTKVYSFFINLINPNFEWTEIDGDENAKIQPATVDRWMVRIFFTRPLKNLIEELQDEGIIIINDEDAQDVFITEAIKNLNNRDDVRRAIVKLMNEKLEKYKLDLKAQQLQAFGWVKIRTDFGLPSADFASFEDVVDFTKKISDRIDDINPELNFINNYGQDVKEETRKVLQSINLLAKMPRFNFKDEKDIENVMKNWKEFEKEYELDFSNKPKKPIAMRTGHSKQKRKFLFSPFEVAPGVWKTPIKSGGKVLVNVKGGSRNDVIKAATAWINKNKPFK